MTNVQPEMGVLYTLGEADVYTSSVFMTKIMYRGSHNHGLEIDCKAIPKWFHVEIHDLADQVRK